MYLKNLLKQVEQNYVSDVEISELEINRKYCNDTLTKVSRSFAMVIQQLPADAKEAIGIFYLVLRGLDTIEDDPDLALDNKHDLIEEFCNHLGDITYRVENVGDKPEYVDLMRQFYRVNHVYSSLSDDYKQVIEDKCRLMAKGMVAYTTKEIVTRADFNEYCYYVAGVVGEGLTGIFANSGYEAFQSDDLSISMGLFLQKTNIIRDYLEDIDNDRVFWPKDVWAQYAPELAYFKEHPTEDQSIHCVNDLITDTLNHLPDCIAYLSNLKHPAVLRFCAIPQLMAMGTLVKLYNNPKVFTQVVKINKVIAMQIVQGGGSMKSIKKWYRGFLSDLEKKLSTSDPSYAKTVAAIQKCNASLK